MARWLLFSPVCYGDIEGTSLQSLCAHKISFMQHFTRTHLYLEQRVRNLCQKIFWKEHLWALKVLHSLQGTLIVIWVVTLSQWCILHIPPYFHKIHKFPPYFINISKFPFSFDLWFFRWTYVCFLSSLSWPWCICSSCFTRTGDDRTCWEDSWHSTSDDQHRQSLVVLDRIQRLLHLKPTNTVRHLLSVGISWL